MAVLHPPPYEQRPRSLCQRSTILERARRQFDFREIKYRVVLKALVSRLANPHAGSETKP